MSYLDTNRLANQMGERGKSYTGEALQCKRRQVVYREDYCAYSEIHCDRASFLLCRLLKKSKKQIPRGLNPLVMTKINELRRRPGKARTTRMPLFSAVSITGP